MSDQWTQNLAQKLRDRKQRDAIQDTKFVEKQNLKRKFGPPLWGEVKVAVQKYCNDLNQEMGEPVLSFKPVVSTSIVVTTQTAPLMQGGELRTLNATFDADTGRISYDSGNYQGVFDLSIDENGKGQFCSGMVPSAPDSIAREMIGSLMQ